MNWHLFIPHVARQVANWHNGGECEACNTQCARVVLVRILSVVTRAHECANECVCLYSTSLCHLEMARSTVHRTTSIHILCMDVVPHVLHSRKVLSIKLFFLFSAYRTSNNCQVCFCILCLKVSFAIISLLWGRVALKGEMIPLTLNGQRKQHHFFLACGS